MNDGGELAAARAGRLDLEDALHGLVELPFTLEREALRERLLRAIQYTYVVLRSPLMATAHLVGLQEATAIAGEVLAMLRKAAPGDSKPLRAVTGALTAAQDTLSAAADRVGRAQLARRDEIIGGSPDPVAPPIHPFAICDGVPGLFGFARQPLAMAVDVGQNPEPTLPDEAPPKLDLSDAQALAERLGRGEPLALGKTSSETDAPRVSASDEVIYAFEPAIEETEVLRRLARDCLEDLAIHRNLRKPNAIETWLDQAPFEQQMLRRLDALMALGGPAVRAIPLFAAELDQPDPERAFAAALSLGCIDGYDTLVASLCLARQSAPEVFEGLIEGFALASNGALDGAFVELSAARQPALAGLALDILLHRGVFPHATLDVLLARQEPDVRWRVARMLASLQPRARAVQLLLPRLETSDDAEMVAAAEALFLLGHEAAWDVVRATTDAAPDSPRALLLLPLLAYAGTHRDADRVIRGSKFAPTVTITNALGRSGDPGAAGRLVELLSSDNEDVVKAAAMGLERLTGAGLRAIVEEPWELSLPPGAREALPVRVPMRRVERVVADPDTWNAWLDEHGADLPVGPKVRHGRPFHPVQIFAELESPLTPAEAREEAARELSLVLGRPNVFWPGDWVARQQQRLAALRDEVSGAAYTEGRWPARRTEDALDFRYRSAR